MYKGTTPAFNINIKIPVYKGQTTTETSCPFTFYRIRAILSQGASTTKIKTYDVFPIDDSIKTSGKITQTWELTEEEINVFEANMPLRFQARVAFWTDNTKPDPKTIQPAAVMASGANEIEIGYIADIIKAKEWVTGVTNYE